MHGYILRHLTILGASLISSLSLMASPAAADIEVSFSAGQIEGFTITNLDACPLENTTIEIDMRPSIGGLVIDTEAGPPGLNRAQAFGVLFGEDYLSQVPVVRDGGDKIVLQVRDLPGEEFIMLTMDTDHMKLGGGAVAFTEHIEDGTVIIGDNEPVTFDAGGFALIPGGDCVA